MSSSISLETMQFLMGVCCKFGCYLKSFFIIKRLVASSGLYVSLYTFIQDCKAPATIQYTAQIQNTRFLPFNVSMFLHGEVSVGCL